MKNFYGIFLFLFSAINIAADPLLVVVFMVKDESLVIKESLQPFIKAGISDFLIFDTGSTDGTPQIARDFFKEQGIANAYIIEEPFVDFSTSRNRALELTEQLFPEATFMVMPDAEWYMRFPEGLLSFCAQHAHSSESSYLISIKNECTAFYVARLIRCRSGVKFVGPVHECLNCISTTKVPSATYFEWGYSSRGIEKTKSRWIRDRALLHMYYEQNPKDPRTLFYLAQTYEGLGDLPAAYEFYEKRAAINGWDEENFMTQLRLGNLAVQLHDPNQPEISHQALLHYLKAFEMRPHRAEPLIKLAQHYRSKGLLHLAYLFASRTAHMIYPQQDILFVDKYVYDFERYEMLSIVSWYVGDYALGAWATHKALEVKPDASYLRYNLECYNSKR